MQVPSSCGRREDAAWGVAAVIAAALCLLAVPAMPLLWAVGRFTDAADR